MTVVVNELPTPVLSANGGELSTAAGFDTYQWYLDGSPIPNVITETFTATENGNYTVTVTTSAGCEGTSAVETVAALGIADISGISIKIYPNPTTGMVNIQSDIPVNVAVYGMDGKIIVRANNHSPVQSSQIDLSHVAAGVYTVKITDETGGFVKMERIRKSEP
jgi:hypothetical protein